MLGPYSELLPQKLWYLDNLCWVVQRQCNNPDKTVTLQRSIRLHSANGLDNPYYIVNFQPFARLSLIEKYRGQYVPDCIWYAGSARNERCDSVSIVQHHSLT